MEDYDVAAGILAKLKQKKGSVKGLCLAPNVQNKKKVYALVCQTLKFHAILSEVIAQADLLAKEHRLTPELALVLVHDLLFARRGILCGGWAKPVVQRHRPLLRDSLGSAARKRGLAIDGMGHAKVAAAVSAWVEAKQAVPLPRYVRVNLLKATPTQVKNHFKAAGWTDGGVMGDWKAISQKHFYQDPHLSDLLVFPNGTDFHLDALYKSGGIILQDKASSFPAHVLAAPPNAHCVDGFAAPGNKTSHLSALLHNTGRITAYDLDSRRLDLLCTMTARAGCINVNPVHGSFLDVDPNKMQRVSHVLLDPSCSGSGIVSRLDHLVDRIADGLDEEVDEAEAVDETRIKALSDFQVQVVLHAMKFPNAQAITYSTCSIHAAENEGVVSRVLSSTSDYVLAPRSRVLPSWPRRGDRNAGLTDAQADQVVRCDPDHGANGFFVARFERVGYSPDMPLPTVDVADVPEEPTYHVEPTAPVVPADVDGYYQEDPDEDDGAAKAWRRPRPAGEKVAEQEQRPHKPRARGKRIAKSAPPARLKFGLKAAVPIVPSSTSSGAVKRSAPTSTSASATGSSSSAADGKPAKKKQKRVHKKLGIK
ncbi:S-adenosyl-L-methionine-dependent methyltransferase [Blastocladiella britannica]|nr:S-adenosyl-L-methionine-dependent methyltransferase [Blastocladiella britannica]